MKTCIEKVAKTAGVVVAAVILALFVSGCGLIQSLHGEYALKTSLDEDKKLRKE